MKNIKALFIFTALLIILNLCNFVSAADYRNFYGINWVGKTCESVDYAKSMGYDYVVYREGLEDCANAKNLYFYVESPDQLSMPIDRIQTSTIYSSTDKAAYNDFFAWKSDTASFPKNLVYGWWFSSSSFRPQPDFQRQEIVDKAVTTVLAKISLMENKANNFLFGGYIWDVSRLEGDLWNTSQYNSDGSRASGQQVLINYWTKSCSAIKHPGKTYKYSCFRDGRAAFMVKLFNETKKKYPSMKFVTEPWFVYPNWIKEINNRTDKAKLTPDLMLEECYSTMAFLTDSRVYITGVTKNKIGYTATDATVNRDKVFLNLSGSTAKVGGWPAFFGRFGRGKYAYSSINQVPAREKLVKIFPVWDNLNNVSLSARKWDNKTLVYNSTKSFASLNMIYTTNPKTKAIYAVINSKDKGYVSIGTKKVVSIYSVDGLFRPLANATKDFIISGGKLTLKDSSKQYKGYIIKLA